MLNFVIQIDHDKCYPMDVKLLPNAWLSGNALVLINVVALRRAQLVMGWVTVRWYTILVFMLVIFNVAIT